MELLTVFGQSNYVSRDLQLFGDVSENDLAVINNIIAPCGVISVKAGTAVTRAHATDTQLYIVLQGALLAQPQENTSLPANSAYYLPGECVGEFSVLDDAHQPNTIIAACNSELLVLDPETVWRLIDESNGVARNLLRQLSFRIRTTHAFLRRRHKVGEFYRQMSMTDALTGIHNRAWLNSQLPNMIENSLSTNKPLSIIMADLDHFKMFNDTHGHIIGDDAIQCAATTLNTTLRPTDYAVRFGGEELMVILPDTTKEAGYSVAKRLCSKLAKSSVFKDDRAPLPHITASFGVANLLPGQDFFSLIASADEALYRAKSSGRNQVSY